jgi:transcriptional regulator with XRE-family HTH domain
MEHLGEILRRERLRRVWFQDEVASACGVRRQQLSRYETGAAEPSWAAFRRVLAAFGLQPRIELEPLDADVVAAIERQRRRPPEDWLADVAYAASSLHKLVSGLDWQATGLLAIRLLGAPTPLAELEVEVALDDAGWSRLVDNAQAGWMQVCVPETSYTAYPIDPEHLRRLCAEGDGMLRWLAVDGRLVTRVVDRIEGQPVRAEVDGVSWRVAGVDRLDFDDPWMARVLRQLRRHRKSDDSPGPLP